MDLEQGQSQLSSGSSGQQPLLSRAAQEQPATICPCYPIRIMIVISVLLAFFCGFYMVAADSGAGALVALSVTVLGTVLVFRGYSSLMSCLEANWKICNAWEQAKVRNRLHKLLAGVDERAKRARGKISSSFVLTLVSDATLIGFFIIKPSDLIDGRTSSSRTPTISLLKSLLASLIGTCHLVFLASIAMQPNALQLLVTPRNIPCLIDKLRSWFSVMLHKSAFGTISDVLFVYLVNAGMMPLICEYTTDPPEVPDLGLQCWNNSLHWAISLFSFVGLAGNAMWIFASVVRKLGIPKSLVGRLDLHIEGHYMKKGDDKTAQILFADGPDGEIRLEFSFSRSERGCLNRIKRWIQPFGHSRQVGNMKIVNAQEYRGELKPTKKELPVFGRVLAHARTMTSIFCRRTCACRENTIESEDSCEGVRVTLRYNRKEGELTIKLNSDSPNSAANARSSDDAAEVIGSWQKYASEPEPFLQDPIAAYGLSVIKLIASVVWTAAVPYLQRDSSTRAIATAVLVVCAAITAGITWQHPPGVFRIRNMFLLGGACSAAILSICSFALVLNASASETTHIIQICRLMSRAHALRPLLIMMACALLMWVLLKCGKLRNVFSMYHDEASRQCLEIPSEKSLQHHEYTLAEWQEDHRKAKLLFTDAQPNEIYSETLGHCYITHVLRESEFEAFSDWAEREEVQLDYLGVIHAAVKTQPVEVTNQSASRNLMVHTHPVWREVPLVKLRRKALGHSRKATAAVITLAKAKEELIRRGKEFKVAATPAVLTVGGTGAGKSTLLCALLGLPMRNNAVKLSSLSATGRRVTQEPAAVHFEYEDDKAVIFIDTLGLNDGMEDEDREHLNQLKRTLAKSGLDRATTSLLVVSCDDKRYAKQTHTLTMLRLHFGVELLRNMLIVFTSGGQLSSKAQETHVKEFAMVFEMVFPGAALERGLPAEHQPCTDKDPGIPCVFIDSMAALPGQGHLFSYEAQVEAQEKVIGILDYLQNGMKGRKQEECWYNLNSWPPMISRVRMPKIFGRGEAAELYPDFSFGGIVKGRVLNCESCLSDIDENGTQSIKVECEQLELSTWISGLIKCTAPAKGPPDHRSSHLCELRVSTAGSTGSSCHKFVMQVGRDDKELSSWLRPYGRTMRKDIRSALENYMEGGVPFPDPPADFWHGGMERVKLKQYDFPRSAKGIEFAFGRPDKALSFGLINADRSHQKVAFVMHIHRGATERKLYCKHGAENHWEELDVTSDEGKCKVVIENDRRVSLYLNDEHRRSLREINFPSLEIVVADSESPSIEYIYDDIDEDLANGEEEVTKAVLEERRQSPELKFFFEDLKNEREERHKIEREHQAKLKEMGDQHRAEVAEKTLLRQQLAESKRECQETAKQLLASKYGIEDIEKRDGTGRTQLSLEAGRVLFLEVDKFKYLIQAGADVNSPDVKGATPLHWACTCGNTEGVKNLLQAEAEVNAAAKNGLTPLDMGLRMQDFNVAANAAIHELLKKAGGKTKAELLKSQRRSE